MYGIGREQLRRVTLGLGLLGVLVALFVFVPAVLAQEGGEGDIRSPDECAECHPEAFESWHTTLHATTSERPEFISAWADAGRPAYCRQCHGTGYDAQTGEFVFEDVTCQSCHVELGDQPHPAGDMSVDTSAELCGSCHSGVHSPTFEEWLLSDHGTMGIECLTCHDPHNDGMRADNVNELCGRCHKDQSADDNVHNMTGMDCSFCHMYGAQQLRGPGEDSPGTGHAFDIAPDVCAECHGMTHTLTVSDVSEDSIDAAAVDNAADAADETEDVEMLEEQVVELEERAQSNLDLGLVGGGLGGIVLGAAGVWALRRGKTA